MSKKEYIKESEAQKTDAKQEKELEVVIELDQDEKSRVVNLTFCGLTLQEAIKKIKKVEKYDRVVDVSHLR